MLLLGGNSILAQNTLPKLSLNTRNKSRQEIFAEIEEKTSFQFYYAEEWLKGLNVSEAFVNESIEHILDVIFENTTINFFITNDNTVVLTKNNIIYGELPQGFFKESNVSAPILEEETLATPVFIKKQEANLNAVTKTIQIGKENKTNRKRRFRLSGYITNEETGKPIPNLAVVVKAHNYGVITNDLSVLNIRVNDISNRNRIFVLKAKYLSNIHFLCTKGFL